MARVKWRQARKRCCKSRLRWSWLGTRRPERVEIAAEESQIQPWWCQFQLGQNSDDGGFPNSWSQVRMDERISVHNNNDDQSTFSAQAQVESSNSSNQRARSINDKMFLQTAQQDIKDAKMILEQNRMLVEEISQNQENRDIDGLTRNAELIRQVNVNIAYMFDLYSDISGSFADYVAAKKATNTGEHNASDSANP